MPRQASHLYPRLMLQRLLGELKAKVHVPPAEQHLNIHQNIAWRRQSCRQRQWRQAAAAACALAGPRTACMHLWAFHQLRARLERPRLAFRLPEMWHRHVGSQVLVIALHDVRDQSRCLQGFRRVKTALPRPPGLCRAVPALACLSIEIQVWSIVTTADALDCKRREGPRQPRR